MKDFLKLPLGMDRGGVHLNSGIPNHAFYLAAIAIGGYAWEGPAQIWFGAMTDDEMHKDCDFVTFARVTVRVAKDSYGDEVSGKVRKAWETVGVL